MNGYVCKYDKSNIGSSNKLLTEYIGAYFLQKWGLGIPDFSLIKIDYSHIPEEFHLPKKCFSRICFGSKFDRNFDDLTHFSDYIKKTNKVKYGNIDELIMVALFDIWMGNDDRNHNNYNLMIDIRNERRFVPIDHETLFNGTTYNMDIYEISYSETIIATELFASLFNRKYFNQQKLREIRNEFYLCCEVSENSFDELINGIPESWNINLDVLNNKMQQVFNPNWIKTSFSTFLQYLSIQFKK